MAASTQWNEAAIRDLLTSPTGPVWLQLNQIGNQVLNRAKQKCPVDKGPLRASLTLDMQVRGNSVVAVIGSALEYAVWVHEGTGIYAGRGYITPRHGQFMRWPRRGGRGGFVYARRTRGMKGRPFLRDALNEIVG